MLSLIVSIATGLLLWLGSYHFIGHVWGGILGAVGFMGVSAALAFYVKKKMELGFRVVQEHLMSIQQKTMQKAKMMQMKGISDPKAMQSLLEKDFHVGVRKGIAMLEDLRPLYKWNFLAERQINTMRAQLHYQIQEFDAADKCLAKCLMLDPMVFGMAIARAYLKDDLKKAEKLFKKGTGRFKDDKGAILYATWAWCLIEKDRAQEAMEMLAKVKDKCGNEVIKQNWEHLANNRAAKFSNAGFGEAWYALQLEQPRQMKMKPPAHMRPRR
jgi:tetratricopeptide (TPR) repeat protein